MALMNMHANLLIKLIILLKIHLSSQGHFCDDFNMFPPLVMHGAIENHFCSPFGKVAASERGIEHLQMRRRRHGAGRGQHIRGVECGRRYRRQLVQPEDKEG